jgi:hypothetical protein
LTNIFKSTPKAHTIGVVIIHLVSKFIKYPAFQAQIHSENKRFVFTQIEIQIDLQDLRGPCFEIRRIVQFIYEEDSSETYLIHKFD